MIELFQSAQLLLGQAGGDAAEVVPQANGLSQILGTFMPLIMIFVIFYFLLVRPQQKKQQQQQQMLQSLKRGDKVITNGGIYGTIDDIDEKTVQLKIANQVKIKMLRSAIAGMEQSGASESSEK